MLLYYSNNMIVPKSKFYLGVFGEKLVHKSLEGSIWMRNTNTGGRDSHDIEWNGIKIEVKTSRRMMSTRDGFVTQFSVLSSDAKIFVFLVIGNRGEIYFWVKSEKEFYTSVYLKSSDSINNLELLPDEIMKAKNRKNKDIEVAYGI